MLRGIVFLCWLGVVCPVYAQQEKTGDITPEKPFESSAPLEKVKQSLPEQKNGRPLQATGEVEQKAPQGKRAEVDSQEAGGKGEKESYISERHYRFRRGEKEVNFEFGISPFRPTHFSGPEEYDTEDRKLGMVTFRWGRVIGTQKSITYQYLFEVIPFVYSYRNEVKNPDYRDWKETPRELPTMRKNTYGIAVTPLAFRLYFFSKSRLKPFAQFGAGMIFTNKPLPLPNTSSYNFTGYYGGGFLYHLTRKTAVTLSYRYYHISNFNTTDFNPGYNANTFAVGYSYFFK